MSITEIFLLIIVIINVVLALLVVSSNIHDLVNIYFSLFAGSLALWAGSLLIFRIADNTDVTIFFLKLSYLAAIFIASSFYTFIHYFPEQTPLGKLKATFLITSTVLLTAGLLLPGVLVVGIQYTPDARIGIQENIGYGIFTFYFILYFFGALYTLYGKWKKETGETRVRLGYILWSVLTAGILGAVFNLILPSPLIAEWRFTWLGPIFTALIVIAVSYAITKHRLLNVKVIAAEMLGYGVVLVQFIQLLFAQTLQDIFIRFIFFAVVAFLGSFLVRSVRTEVKQKEELEKLSVRLEETNLQLKRLDETKSEFVSIASHQLRTPLTVIKGYLSMLLEGSFGKIPDQQEGPLEKTYESANRLIELVENLLNISRIESGRMKYTMAPTQIADLAASVVDEIMPNAQKKNLHLQYIAPRAALPLVEVDGDKIRQVMMNMVDNAVKYTKKGSVSVGVRVELGSPDQRITKPSVVFEVKDTGNGVRPDDMDRLFNKFIRGQGSSLVHTEGTGLGLYVGRMMVEAHHGQIWVESKGEGFGSTFAFALPLPPTPDMGRESFESMMKNL